MLLFLFVFVSDLSGGQRCPPFEQLGPEKDIKQISFLKKLKLFKLEKVGPISSSFYPYVHPCHS